MTPPLACLLSATSGIPPHSTGKERNIESGNDYFGARYYSSGMGRLLIPDWSAQVEPVPYAKLGNPQTLNLYAYMLNNPLGGVDQDGYEIVQLGQHTDKEIAAQTTALNKQLENKDLSASDRSSINGKIQTLATEKEGNAVGNAFLSRLDTVGERGDLKLSDLSVTTDPANDFKRKVDADDLAHLASPSVKDLGCKDRFTSHRVLSTTGQSILSIVRHCVNNCPMLVVQL